MEWVMKHRNPLSVHKLLMKTYQSIAKSAINAKVMKLQNVEMSAKESILEYVNQL